MKLASEMPQLLDSNTSHGTHFDSIKTAIAYLSASEEVKAEVDASTEPVTEKLIKQLKADYAGRNTPPPLRFFFWER